MSSLLRQISNGIEFYTRMSDGASGMSQSGLACLCGISQQTMSALVKEISSTGKHTPQFLKPFAGKDLNLETGTGSLFTAYVLPDDFCAAAIEYYAYESRYKNETALLSYRTFARLGIRGWIQSHTGWGSNILRTPEELLLDQIMDLASYSNIKLRKEVSVLDTLEGSSSTSKRYDALQRYGKTVRIYEFKKDTITLQDVALTIGEKGYYKLALENYPNKKIDFVFISPNEPEPAAKRLIESMAENIRWMSIASLSVHLLKNIKNNTPKEAYWYVKNKIIPRYTNLLPQLPQAA